MTSLIAVLALASSAAGGEDLYRYKEGEQSRWASPENRAAAKGAGGRENKGAKGHAWDRMQPGEAYVLADVPSDLLHRERVTLEVQTLINNAEFEIFLVRYLD